MKSLTIPKSKHFIRIQFSINLSWQAATVPCKSCNLFASSHMKWVLWPLIMNRGKPLTLSGYHLVQQQRQPSQQHIMGIQLRIKFSAEKKSKDEARVCLNPRIKDSLEEASAPMRPGHNKYSRTVKDTFRLLKLNLLSDSDQSKLLSDVQEGKHKKSSSSLVKNFQLFASWDLEKNQMVISVQIIWEVNIVTAFSVRREVTIPQQTLPCQAAVLEKATQTPVDQQPACEVTASQQGQYQQTGEKLR